MGYSHYYLQPKELPLTEWNTFTERVRKIVDRCREIDIAIGNYAGDPGSQPEITDKVVGLNGRDDQPLGYWTTTDDVRLPWPSEFAGIDEDLPGKVSKDGWHAGDLVNQRVAPEQNGTGQGSYETFYIERVINDGFCNDGLENGLMFRFCKTAYRPYDLTVTAALLAFKETFGDRVIVRSDGEDKDWLDAKIMNYQLFGYGLDYAIERNQEGQHVLVANENVTK